VIITAAVLAASAVAFSLLSGDREDVAPPAADVPRLEKGRIVFSKSFRDRMKLVAEPVRSAPLTPSISAVGMVTFDPRHTARVGTRLRSVVRSLLAYEGAEVTRGQPLAEINSPELGEAQAQVTMLAAQSVAATRQAEREAALAATKLSTAREAESAVAERSRYESMLRAAKQRVAALAGPASAPKDDPKAVLGTHTLTAPIAGTIVERNISQGELVEGDHVAFLIANLDHLWVELDVFERSLGAIRVGDEVDLKALSGAGGTIKGRVAHVGAVIDPATRSAPIRIEIDNSKRLLRPGQAVDAVIAASSATMANVLLVPTSAVTYVDGQPTVFVLVEPLVVLPAPVELGESNGRQWRVLKGLSAGQQVVTQGVFELKSELFR
jgi:cobalt-zinc-cadmium efflux system membrane fusion protein